MLSVCLDLWTIDCVNITISATPLKACIKNTSYININLLIVLVQVLVYIYLFVI